MSSWEHLGLGFLLSYSFIGFINTLEVLLSQTAVIEV
jgi:hypothetical protein